MLAEVVVRVSEIVVHARERLGSDIHLLFYHPDSTVDTFKTHTAGKERYFD